MVKSKKDPLKADDPFDKEKYGRSDAGVGAPAPEKPKDLTPKIIRDENTGEKTGIELPNGKSYFGIPPKEVDFIAKKWHDRTAAPAGTEFADLKPPVEKVEGASPELISQIGQQVPASIPELADKPSTMQVLRTAGERAAIAGAGGIISGAVGGGALAGLPGAIAGGAGLGVGAAVTAGIATLFSEYKKSDKANFDIAADNYDRAQDNLYAAIDLANKGAGTQANMLAVKNYNKALAEINLAERQLKELGNQNQNQYIREIKDKLRDVQDFKVNDRARLDEYMEFALQKPIKSYVNEGVIQ